MARGCDTGNIVCPSGLSGISSVENNFAMSQLLKTFVALDIIILFLEIDSMYIYTYIYIMCMYTWQNNYLQKIGRPLLI